MTRRGRDQGGGGPSLRFDGTHTKIISLESSRQGEFDGLYGRTDYGHTIISILSDSIRFARYKQNH